MRTTCENCRTVYDSVPCDTGSLCPYCDHVNLPPRPDPETPIWTNHEADPLKTMVLPVNVGACSVSPVTAKPVAAVVRPAGMQLIMVVNGQLTERYKIGLRRTTIGRGLCDIRVEDPEVSREHCSIKLRDGVPVLTDLASANGTLLNGQSVNEHALADGDEIQVGSTVLRFHVG